MKLWTANIGCARGLCDMQRGMQREGDEDGSRCTHLRRSLVLLSFCLALRMRVCVYILHMHLTIPPSLNA